MTVQQESMMKAYIKNLSLNEMAVIVDGKFVDMVFDRCVDAENAMTIFGESSPELEMFCDDVNGGFIYFVTIEI